MGYILLEGGAEFGGQMAIPDRRAMELAGGLDEPIVIIPTAAAPDNNHNRAGNNGQRWFASLGATNVTVVPITDKASANATDIADRLRQAKLVYMLGGFTHYLGQTLQDSEAWRGVLDAYENGGVIAGSSAGAMVLCEYYYNPNKDEIVRGLNLVPNACVLPHHNTFGKSWAAQLRQKLPSVTLMGIDEQTGMINEGESNQWRVLGASSIVIYGAGVDHMENAHVYENGDDFSLSNSLPPA